MGSTWMGATMRSPLQRKVRNLQWDSAQADWSSRSTNQTDKPAHPLPDLFVVLPKTLAASPKAASDGPVLVMRAAAPASSPKAARLLTACGLVLNVVTGC